MKLEDVFSRLKGVEIRSIALWYGIVIFSAAVLFGVCAIFYLMFMLSPWAAFLTFVFSSAIISMLWGADV